MEWSGVIAVSLAAHSALNRVFRINSGFCLSNPIAKKENVKSYNSIHFHLALLR